MEAQADIHPCCLYMAQTDFVMMGSNMIQLNAWELTLMLPYIDFFPFLLDLQTDINSFKMQTSRKTHTPNMTDFDHSSTRGPLVLYRSLECWGYAELEQTWKYISTQCCISFHHAEAFRNKSDLVIKMVMVNPGSSYEILVVLEYPSFKAPGLLIPKKKIF